MQAVGGTEPGLPLGFFDAIPAATLQHDSAFGNGVSAGEGLSQPAVK